MKNISAEELKDILEKHRHWLYKGCEGWEDMRADLRDADLRDADLRDADLSFADLRDANLRGADLRDADLRDAKNVPYIPMVCPEEGDFIGWKKAYSLACPKKFIVKLKIPASAKRSSATARKCRCSKARVLEIYNLDGTIAEERMCYSQHDNNFVYEVGKTVKVDNFDDNRWKECATGIHFFMNRQEALNY